MKFLKKLSFERGLQILVGLNLLDALSTDLMLRGGGAELNPVMAWAYGISPVVFWLMKIGLVVVALALLALAPAVAPFFNRDPGKTEQKTQLTILAAIGMYLLVFLTHVIGWLGTL